MYLLGLEQVKGMLIGGSIFLLGCVGSLSTVKDSEKKIYGQKYIYY